METTTKNIDGRTEAEPSASDSAGGEIGGDGSGARWPILRGARGPFALLTAFYLAHIFLIVADGHLRPHRLKVRGHDAVGYYAYFHSLYFDRDFDFSNQNDLFGEGYIAEGRTPTGLQYNVFSVGPAIALAPFWIVADVVARLGPWDADGTSTPYHFATFIGLAVYGFIALVLMAVWGRRRFGPWPAAWAAILVWGGSTLLFYCGPLTLMPHAIGAAGAALFMVGVEAADAPTRRAALLGGAALGVAMLMRWQSALFVIYPLSLSVARWLAAGDRRRSTREEGQYWALFAAAAIVLFSPQLMAWQVLYGRPLLIPQGEDFLLPGRPVVFGLLFSMRCGLFTWTPWMAVAVVGVVVGLRSARAPAVGLLLIFVAQVYLNSTVADWNGGWAYGMRRFTELAPVFAFGVASLLTLSAAAPWRRGFVGLGLVFFLWNEVTVYQYTFHMIPWDQSLTAHEVFGDKLHLSSSRQRRYWIDTAWIHFNEGNKDKAMRSIAVAKEFDLHHDDVYIEQGLLHERYGEFEKATAEFEKALAFRPKNQHTRNHLERVARKMAERDGDGRGEDERAGFGRGEAERGGDKPSGASGAGAEPNH